MTINLTNFTNANNILDIAQYSNNSTGGLLFNGLIIVIFLILVMAFYQYPLKYRVLVAGWICTVLSSLLWFAGLLQLGFVLGFLATTFLLFIFSKLVNE